MAGKKRRKRRAHRAQGATTAPCRARQRQAASAGSRLASLVSAPSGTTVTASIEPGPAPVIAGRGSLPSSVPVTPAFGRVGRMVTALLPGRVFFAISRPVAGVVCCVLQATLLGWVPAALWASQAKRRVADKQRGLAARLRSL